MKTEISLFSARSFQFSSEFDIFQEMPLDKFYLNSLFVLILFLIGYELREH